MIDEPDTRGGRLRQSRKSDQALTLGRRLIVTIGIDAYDREQWTPLHNAVNDARGVHKLFTETLGFEAPFPPLLDADATGLAIRALIETDLPNAVEEDDAVVVFFAGHGLSREIGKNHRGYLIPVNGQRERWSTCLRIDHVLDNLNDLPARHVVVIVDACHSGFALGNTLVRGRGDELPPFAGHLLSKKSRRVLTSAMAEQEAFDGGPVPNHSLFTGWLIHGLRSGLADTDHNGIVTTSELGLFVQSSVADHSQAKQTPDFGRFAPWADEGGELVWAVTGGHDVTVAPAAPVTIRPRAAAAPVAPDWETEPFEPETVVVPAGTFIMGDDDVAHAAPQHTVDLPAFRIGRYPVTNAQFAEFVWKTGRVAPKELLWDGNEPPEEARDHPVTGITWYEAMDYCAWLSETTGRAYTLPSEAQWEKAARGTDGRAYPWGETWDPARCHTDPEGFAAVDAYPAQSPYGGYDMVGNAREWTTTLRGTSSGAPDDRYAYPWADDGRDDVEAPRTTRRVVRGGRGSDPAAYKCAARRSYFPDRPGPRRNRHGFRVVVYES